MKSVWQIPAPDRDEKRLLMVTLVVVSYAARLVATLPFMDRSDPAALPKDMSPLTKLVQRECRFYFIGLTRREVLYSVGALSLDEAWQAFRTCSMSSEPVFSVIKAETEIYPATREIRRIGQQGQRSTLFGQPFKVKRRSLGDTQHRIRRWRLDVLNVVRSLGKAEFSLREVYAHGDALGRLHPHNRHVRDKIRLDAQVLRDLWLVEFPSRGQYRPRYVRGAVRESPQPTNAPLFTLTS